MPSWKKVITSGSDAHLKTINTDGNISGSSVSTGSFGRVETSVISGLSPLVIEADNVSLDDEGSVSGSSVSTGSFGKIEATTLKGTLETAAQGNVTSLGTLTTLTVDDITLNGSTISDGGDLTLDIGGDLNIDVDGTDIILKDGGTAFGRVKRGSSDFIIKSEANNEDIILRGQDGGSTIDALLLDMSEAGSALFNSDISGSTIRASGDIIAFNSSDERLKDNVEPIKFPLDKLGKIGGYTFDWNDKQQIYHGHDVGVLAQEIEEVLPEAVKDRGSGYKGVQYDKIIPLLIEGIKELKEKVKHIEENCDCLKK